MAQQTVTLDNFGSLNILQKTQLTADMVAGTNVSLAVKNTANYTVGQFIAIGKLGDEQCEIQPIAAITPPSIIQVATLNFNHDEGEQVTGLFGNQINVYSSANVNGYVPADTSFAKLGTVTILGDWTSTDYSDTSSNAGSGSWYKFTYYDSTTSAETQLSDSRAVRGGNYGNYASLAEIRDEAGMTGNDNISDATVDRRRRRAQSVIDGMLTGDYITPFAVPVPSQIEQATIYLAAGYLLISDYGTESTGTSKDGYAKIEQVLQADVKGLPGILDLIKMREIILYDSAGNSLLLEAMVTSYPSTDTPQSDLTSDTNMHDSSGNPEDRYFSMADEF